MGFGSTAGRQAKTVPPCTLAASGLLRPRSGSRPTEEFCRSGCEPTGLPRHPFAKDKRVGARLWKRGGTPVAHEELSFELSGAKFELRVRGPVM
jgi:hypothetical protein